MSAEMNETEIHDRAVECDTAAVCLFVMCSFCCLGDF